MRAGLPVQGIGGGSGATKATGFARFANAIARLSGKPGAFVLAAVTVLIWGITGPIFNYSDTWQLVINTGTTIMTFLMVFLIQNTQNRDSLALQLKLDELILATKEARNELVIIEDASDEEIEARLVEEKERAQAAPPNPPSVNDPSRSKKTRRDQKKTRV
jgi:low affinity Fe/Cu permease